MPENEEKSPYDLLLEDNKKMHDEITSLRKEMSEIVGMNRSLLGRINSGSNDTGPVVDLKALSDKLDGGLKHGS